MKKSFAAIGTLLIMCSCATDKQWAVVSPDGEVSITVKYIKGDSTNLSYSVDYNGTQVILPSPLGIDRTDEQFSRNLKFVSVQSAQIDQEYVLKAGKRLENRDFANEQTLTFKNKNGKQVQLIVRSYDDGVAYRYRFPDTDGSEYCVSRELSGFQLPQSAKAWIHPYDWNSRLKPSYEQYCQSNIDVGTPSPYEQGWAYPMLFNANNAWLMITEATLDGTYCATHIRNTPDGLYTISFPEPDEVIVADDPQPKSTLPWATPWRVIAVGGQLATIVETNIVQNLNPECALEDVSWIVPGRSSWSWWSDGGSARRYKDQIEYIDFTADMGWEYVLVDAGWPKLEGGTLEDMAAYAKSKNVGLWLWYHSGAGRTNDTLSANNIISFPEERRKEFARIAAMGVKGIKVDFFDTDKQAVVKLYKEILVDAAQNHIMVNFHGATMPRGLERTYPNLMTTEAIKGAEGFGRQPSCDRAPEHNTTVVFTRNVVGSMDYTPVTFSNKIRQGVEAFNVTSYGHQLGLAVVFESGVQNFADNYKSYMKLPEAPKEFLKYVPTVWDETRFVGGFPGDYAIIARRFGKTWYIGGINGKNVARKVSFELPFIENGKSFNIIADGAERTKFSQSMAVVEGAIEINMLPYGGFAGTIEI